MVLKLMHKEWLVFIITILLLTDLAILLNIPYIRQILGFLFLIFLPGLLILQVLKLNKLGFTEKVVLSVGLSISFLLLFWLLINNLLLSLGYETPLATISILMSFNLVFIVLAILGYKTNKEPIFSLPSLHLNTSEKAFLIVPVLFPALSILGTHLMKTADNNTVLMFMLFLIAFYVLFAALFNQKFPKRLYPLVIFLISISVLMIHMLRFPHIHGSDVHIEYYLFRTTLNNLHWSIWLHILYDACLSISLLPAIFQSVMNVNVNAQEYLFKGVCVAICSFSPLAVYIMPKRYIGESYAFLASFFFIAQPAFLTAARNPRTDIAVFFAALAIMVFFNDKIDPLKRRFLFILFIFSVVVSHYSTAYIFFFITLFTWIAVETFSKRYTLNKKITLTFCLIFFAFIFFWYSQVTETAFSSGIKYVKDTFLNLNSFFIEEARNPAIEHQLVGKELEYGMISRANLVNTWASFILIGIGAVTMVWRYKEMIAIPNINHKKADFLNTKFEMEYLMMALACVGVLVLTVALPYVSTGYGIDRLYPLMIIILSICFIIGGVTVSQTFKKSLIKIFSFRKKALPKTLFASKKPLRKNISQQSFKKHFFFSQKKTCAKRKSINQNGSEVRAYLIILLILIPYFLFYTGAIHQLFGAPSSITLNSVGVEYDRKYVHDQESCAARWLKNYAQGKLYTTDMDSQEKLISQGDFSPNSIDYYSFSKRRKIKGYLYLSYKDVIIKDISPQSGYADMFAGKDSIYDNGVSEVWK